jgi:ABC-type phosphate transport system substrate-binding protein
MRTRLIPVVVALLLAARVAPPEAIAAGAATDATPPAAAVIARSHLAVIVNRANPVVSISRRELRSIFLGEQTTWQHGRRTTPALREPGQPERTAALRLIYGMSEADLSRYFLHRAFIGGTTAGPRTLATAEGVKRFVFNVPGGIGLVRLADLDDSVKVLKIDDAAPGDAAYALVMQEP